MRWSKRNLRRVSTDFFDMVAPMKTQTVLFARLAAAQQRRLEDQRGEGPQHATNFVTKSDIKHVKRAAARRAKFAAKEAKLRARVEKRMARAANKAQAQNKAKESKRARSNAPVRKEKCDAGEPRAAQLI